jgi:hypothetical protein
MLRALTISLGCWVTRGLAFRASSISRKTLLSNQPGEGLSMRDQRNRGQTGSDRHRPIGLQHGAESAVYIVANNRAHLAMAAHIIISLAVTMIIGALISALAD